MHSSMNIKLDKLKERLNEIQEMLSQPEVVNDMADRNPVHAEEILRAGNECGLGRVKAGFHYMSDYHVGNLLGEKLYIFMNRESDGS